LIAGTILVYRRHPQKNVDLQAFTIDIERLPAAQKD